MFVLACVRQTEEDLEKERKKQRAENEGVEEGGPGTGMEARTPQAHLPMPHFPSVVSGLAH